MNKVKNSSSNVVTKVDDVHKTFTVGNQELEILKGINFEVLKGDFLILFGPSGCGKSTVLNTILGLEPPTKGTVTFLGNDLYKFNEDERAVIRKKDIGMVYQQSNWIKALNVIENIRFPLTLSGISASESEKKGMELLKMVNMEHAALQTPTELSSGQQQRISLTRALITDPAVIIADEPTGNLDSKAGTEIMNLFKEFHNKGTTVIMVTHDLEYLSYATRSVSMLDGTVVGVYKAGDKELEGLSVSKKTHSAIKPPTAKDGQDQAAQKDKSPVEEAIDSKEELVKNGEEVSPKVDTTEIKEQSQDEVLGVAEETEKSTKEAVLENEEPKNLVDNNQVAAKKDKFSLNLKRLKRKKK